MTTTSNFDTPWKLILERYLQAAFEFLLPDIAEQIDWDYPYKCLDKELFSLEKASIIKTRLADQLIQVRKKDGEDALVLIHLEVQGSQDKDFAERMYRYYYRIDDRYKQPIMSVAILTDKNPKWRPSRFSRKLWGCEITLDYPIIKLIDFKDDLDRLANSTNPIAKVIEAHLAALLSHNDIQLKTKHKFRLLKNLIHLGYTQEEARVLYEFIDYTINIGAELDKELRIKLKEYEKEVGMQGYISSFERIGREEGFAEGLEQGERKFLKLLLQQRFGIFANKMTDVIDRASESELERLLKIALQANKIEDLIENHEPMPMELC